MGTKVITPADPVLTTAEARLQVRLTPDDSTAEDSLIDASVLAAQALAEHYTGRPIGTQTRELALDAFPDGAIDLGPAVTSVASVKYIDLNGVEQTLSSGAYSLDNYDGDMDCWLVPAVNTVWPATMACANAVKVRYVAGDVPAAVRSAMLLIVAHLYANRQEVITDAREVAVQIPMGAMALLDTVKVWGF